MKKAMNLYKSQQKAPHILQAQKILKKILDQRKK